MSKVKHEAGLTDALLQITHTNVRPVVLDCLPEITKDCLPSSNHKWSHRTWIVGYGMVRWTISSRKSRGEAAPIAPSTSLT